MPETTKTQHGGGQSWNAAPIVNSIPKVSSGTDDMEDSHLRTVEVALTSAQILALNATPVELVAAPGAGKVLHYLGATFIHDYGGTQYANGAVLIVKQGSVAVSADVLAATLTAAADVITSNIPITGVATANTALTLTTATAFITGTGVLRVKVVYAIWDTGL